MYELEAALHRFAFACVRLAPLVVLPALSAFAWAPALVRIVVLLALALALASVAQAAPMAQIGTPGAFVHALGNEALFGLLLAFAIALPSAALSFAGRLIDTQSGFSAANLLNPGRENDAESLLGTALLLSATVLFFLLDLHLDLLAVLVRMLDVAPLGAITGVGEPAPLLQAMSVQFLLGFMVAAPVAITMLTIDVAAAYATRSMPQANVYFLALPFKIAAAILVLAATLQHLPLLIGRMYAESIDTLPGLMDATP